MPSSCKVSAGVCLCLKLSWESCGCPLSAGDQLEKSTRAVIRAMALGSERGLNESTLHPVWRKLPVELVEVVLKCVPFESLVRFRAVCKRFNSLITSPEFARKCQKQQASKPVPVIVPDFIQQESWSVKVFNTKTNSWLTCHLPIFEDDLSPLELTAASGGLVCFETDPFFGDLDFRTFVVCNLLTGAFKRLELPTPHERDIDTKRAFTSLVVNLQAGTFTLVVVTASNKEAGRKTFLYDSADGSWRSGAPLPDVQCFDRALSFNTVTSNGSIYICLNPSPFSKVLKYDVRNDRWSEISLAIVQYDEWEDLEILENRCEVVLVFTWTKHRTVNNVGQFHHKKIFYIVREAAACHGETLVEDRMVFQALDENEWIKDVTEDVATVGIGDVICAVRCEQNGNPMRVSHFNCSTQKLSLLPDCGIDGELKFTLKLLEPSLAVDL